MRSPFKAIFYFCLFLVILVFSLFAIRGINPLALNVFNLKPLVGKLPSVATGANVSSVPKPNLSQQIVLTEADVQKLVTASASDYVQNPSIKINQSNISVSADIIKVIKTHADLTLRIAFANGKVSSEITDLKTGTLGAPSWLKTTIAELINKKLDSDLNNKYKVSSISQQTGKIIIEVK